MASRSRGCWGRFTTIFTGSDLGLTEAPHLFKRDGWYYLTTAEGGTGYDHAVTMARSRSITGPYEMHPQKHLLTTRFAPESPLQRTGHGQYVETPTGEAYHSFLCGRPLVGPGWQGFLRLGTRDGTREMRLGGRRLAVSRRRRVGAALDGASHGQPACRTCRCRAVFADSLPPEFQWLRTPEPDRIFQMTGQVAAADWPRKPWLVV